MEAAKEPIYAGVRKLPPAAANGEKNGITKYSNRIQGFAYGGAAALVVIIGLRSVYGRAIPSWVVISGLLLEAVLLLMIAAVYYFTPEEKGGAQPSTESQILKSENEILGLLRNNVLQGEGEMQRQILQTLQQQSKAIGSIEEQITILLKKEVDNIVEAKVRELFAGMIRKETDKDIRRGS